MNLLNELREAMARLDATITNPDMKGVDDRPPEGDDYNALAALVEDWLSRAEVQLPDLEQRLRDIAAGARSKADLIASKSPTSVYTDPVDVLRALAKEAERGLAPVEPVEDNRTIPSYVVRWEVDAEADNPRMAAQDVADQYFQDRISAGRPDTACVFTVIDSLTGESTEVDLAKPED